MTKKKINLVIISGRSGSGKSVALRVLEDLGYYCIDNLPVNFVSELCELARANYPKLAVSIDIRNMPEESSTLDDIYQKVKQDEQFATTIMYVDAEDAVLAKRYLETRRLHPLSRKSLSLEEAIVQERDLLAPLSALADLRIDTSNSSIHDLSTEITTLVQGKPNKELVIVFESFGFKNGIAKDADFVFDSRFLPNPYWDSKLRKLTGLDQEIKDFFKEYDEVVKYIGQIDKLLMDHLSLISQSNRSYLTIAIGCTGGRHRSVYIAQNLADRFKLRGINIKVRHRTLDKEQ